jgi:dCMP deaminase
MMRAEHAMSKWDKRFFQLCRLTATWSEDRRRKVGAVIVGSANEVRAIGYNGLPRGVSGEIDIRHSPEEREKYYWFEHAERNAIYNAARAGIGIAGCRLYVSLFPCSDCARGIIQSGIIQVNTFRRPEVDVNFDRSFDVALTMFEEAHIELRIFSKRIMLVSDPHKKK